MQIVPNFRIRTIPVLGTTPAIFGLAAASHILCQLAGQPYAPEPHFRVQVRVAFLRAGRCRRHACLRVPCRARRSNLAPS